LLGYELRRKGPQREQKPCRREAKMRHGVHTGV